LKEYDYSQPWEYFVTICVHNRESLLSEIKNGKMELNIAGQIIEKWWLELPHKFSNIKIDEYIIMPNHLHGIIIIVEKHKIIQWFKTMTANEYIRKGKQNKLTPFHGKFWKCNYCEHIIRNEDELQKIIEYIQNNPLKWHLDRENPKRIAKDVLEEEIFRHSSLKEIVACG